jgi:hypothetical protein
LVLVLMQSAPTGARIVRVSDNYLLGYTPETIEFHQSLKPERIRFEMQGYTSVTRDVSAASDSELTVDLEPIPAKDPHRARPLRN